MPSGSQITTEIARLERALGRVARLVMLDAVYVPIFLRIEREIVSARQMADALDRARAMTEVALGASMGGASKGKHMARLPRSVGSLAHRGPNGSADHA